MSSARPTFLGIGAHKAGTGWLYRQLRRHPEIWMPPRKEIHFFDRTPDYPTPNSLATPALTARLLGSRSWERPRTLRGVGRIGRQLLTGRFRDAAWWSRWIFGYYDERWYASLFAQAGDARACGEISPGYSILEPVDIARIRTLNPDMKIVFVIRNPIERDWSAIRYNVDRKLTDVDLDSPDAVIGFLEGAHVRRRSDYERTLERYLTFFDREQILVGFYDAIQQDPVGLMTGITRFLGVSPFPSDAIDSETRVNASPGRPMPAAVRAFLDETHGPMIERLASRFSGYALRWAAGGSASAANGTSADVARTACRATCHP